MNNKGCITAQGLEEQLAYPKYYTKTFVKNFIIREMSQISEKDRPIFLLSVLKNIKNLQGFWELGKDFYIQYIKDFDLFFESIANQPEVDSLSKFEILNEFIHKDEKNALFTRYVINYIGKNQFDVNQLPEILTHVDDSILNSQDLFILAHLLFQIEGALILDLGETFIFQTIDHYLKAQYDAYDDFFSHKIRFQANNETFISQYKKMFKYNYDRHKLSGKITLPIELTQQKVEKIYENRKNLLQTVQVLLDFLKSTFNKRGQKKIQENNLNSFIFVANNESRGDGYHPETLDFFMNKKYSWLSLLIPKLKEKGFDSKVVSWENSSIDWSKYSVLYLGPVWGYSRQVKKFQDWISKIEKLGVKLVNSISFLKWNIKKSYLKELYVHGIPTIPSIIVDSDDKREWPEIKQLAQDQFSTENFIIKGLVGAGGFDYFHYSNDREVDAKKHFETLLRENEGAVIQPFLKEVKEYGELSFIFYGNVLSHFYLKVPVSNEERVQVFYGGRSFHLASKDFSNLNPYFENIYEFRPDLQFNSEKLRLAYSKIYPLWSRIQEYLHSQKILIPLMVRLDCVLKGNELWIMEIEGLDPYIELNETIQKEKSDSSLNWYVDALIRQQLIFSLDESYEKP